MSYRRILLTLIGAGCSTGVVDDGPSVDDTDEPWTNPTPVLRVVSPGQIVVGDEISFVGEGFVDPEHGQAKVHFVGTFTNDLGQASNVDLTVSPQWVSAGMLTWRMEPNVVFDPSGERIGNFTGQVFVENEPYEQVLEEVKQSVPANVGLDVEPSIIIRSLRPQNSSCTQIVSGTLEGAPLELIADAIGLDAGTVDAPVVAQYQFVAPQFIVLFDGDTLNGVGFHDMDFDPNLPRKNPTPEDLATAQGSILFDQIVANNSARMTLSARWQSRVEVSGGTRFIQMFRAGLLSGPATVQEVAFNVRAEDRNGVVARRTVHTMLRKPAWVTYDGNQRVAERFPPVHVSACTPGATPQTELSYSETVGETRSRSMSFNWNYNVSDSLGLSAGVGFGLPSYNPFMFMPNASINASRTWSEGFGVDVSASISTEQSQIQGISGVVFPGEYGMFYRQTERLSRIGMVTGANECGVSAELGEAVLTDWEWSAELAKGRDCPPDTQLPAAGVFE